VLRQGDIFMPEQKDAKSNDINKVIDNCGCWILLLLVVLSIIGPTFVGMIGIIIKLIKS
jgi:hypothetical protein